jgi:two-component system chemotaxis response regulator CheB
VEKRGKVSCYDFMAARDIIVIGASAGGVETLPKFFEGLNGDLPTAFFVVMHMAPHSKSVMPDLIQRSTRLRAEHAQDNKPFQKGRIYVAPPDCHLLIEKKRVRLSHGAKENRHRPAIDPLFRTAAAHHGAQVIGILLTGTMDDGSLGLREIKRSKGVTIVQDPAEAVYPEMPLNGLRLAKPDLCLTLSQMAAMLPRLISEPIKKNLMQQPGDLGMKPEDKRSKSLSQLARNLGRPSGFVCPDCSGPLWQIQKQNDLHYRCMVGHAFSPETFMASQSEEVEKALWICLRALEQRVELQQRLAQRSTGLKQHVTAQSFIKKAKDNARHARLIRDMLERL